MKTRHSDCEFCHGEEWETVDYRSTFDGLLRIKYHYTDTGTKCEGLACRLCVDYAYNDDEIIVTYLEGVRQCQWCDSTDLYEAGYSPMCVETQYKCRDCNGETWIDDRECK